MPEAYYRDWLRVAACGCVWLSVAGQDALHFSLLVEHLATLGHA